MALTTGKATDLITFSRGTLATVTDADGKIKWAPHNLLPDSENFDASGWTKYLAPVTANAQVAPNGTTTADTITTSDNYSAIYRSIAVTTGAVYTFGFYAKRGTMTEAKLSVYDVNGAANIVAPTSYYSTINSSTWTLVTQTFTVPAGCSTVNVYMLRDGLTTGTIHLWGASLTRADLGGMQANASAFPMYNPSTPKNLLGYSEDFSNAAWTKSGLLAFGSGSTANATIAPNGSQSADLLTESSGGTFHYARQTPTLGSGPHVLSVYAKANGRTWVELINATYSQKAYFNLSGTGSVGTSSGATAVITSVGDGWYRCSILFTATAGVNAIDIRSASADNTDSYSGDGTSGIYLWGAQLSDSASLDAYSPVFGAAPSAAAYHGPRLDYSSSGSALGLLVEEARANLMINSNAPTMGTGLSSTAGAATSPDGTMSAVRVAKTDATTPRYFSSSTIMTTAGGRKYVISRYFKYDGYDVDVSLEYNSTANWDLSWSAIFAVASTGVTVKSDNNTVSSVQNVGNGWYRAITTFTAGAAPSSTSNPAILTRVTGASGVSVLCYGGMVEENASFATSYIPTAAATVTRNADVASVGVSQFPYSATEGTLVAHVSTFDTSSNLPTYINLSDGTVSNYIRMNSSPASYKLRNYTRAAASEIVNATMGGATVANEPFKAGVYYKANSFNSSVNGAISTEVTSGAVPAAATTLSIGNWFTSAGTFLNGHIRQVTYLPRRLTNAELQSRTA